MAGGGGAADSGEPEFQVAPMIDVLLVLLVFFMMITSAQVLKVDQTIKLPVAKNAKKKDENRAETYINIRWDADKKRSEVKFEDKVYPKVEDIIPILRARVKADPKYAAVIRADRNMPAVMITPVMDVIGQAGLADVAFSALNRD